MLNFLQRTPLCKFCSVALIRNKVIAHNTAPFLLLKKRLYLNDQNLTRAVNFSPYFFKMFNPRVRTTLHEKIQIFWSLFNFSTFILFFGRVPPRPPSQNFLKIWLMFVGPLGRYRAFAVQKFVG